MITVSLYCDRAWKKQKLPRRRFSAPEEFCFLVSLKKEA